MLFISAVAILLPFIASVSYQWNLNSTNKTYSPSNAPSAFYTIGPSSAPSQYNTNIKSFGVYATSNSGAHIKNSTLSLWFDDIIYECHPKPMNITTAHGCDHATWTIITNNACSQYKITIDNSDAIEEIAIDRIYVNLTNGTFYGIDGFCVIEELAGDVIVDVPSNECESNYQRSTTVGVDNQQIIYFDETRPNLYINNAVWAAPNDNNIITREFGGTRTNFDVAWDQGRVNSISEWGLYVNANYRSRVQITGWSSDSQTKYYEFGNRAVVTQSCVPFSIDSNDYITGFGVYYDENFVFGIEFLTLNGLNYSCYNPTVVPDKEYSTRSYEFDSSFYYLSLASA